MPRHLISDAHEWMNEIPAVPIYYLAKTTAKGTGLAELAGKEDPVELDSSRGFVAWRRRCRVGGRSPRGVAVENTTTLTAASTQSVKPEGPPRGGPL